jgi:hypothetical protein
MFVLYVTGDDSRTIIVTSSIYIYVELTFLRLDVMNVLFSLERCLYGCFSSYCCTTIQHGRVPASVCVYVYRRELATGLCPAQGVLTHVCKYHSEFMKIIS